MDSISRYSPVTRAPRPFAAIHYVLTTLLLLPLAASAGPTDNGPVTLRLKYKAGDVSTYQETVQMTIQLPNAGKASTGAPSGGIPQTQNMTSTRKVLKALPDGKGEVEMTTTGSFNGIGGGAPSSHTIVVTTDAQGNIVTLNDKTPGAAGASPFASLLQISASGMQGNILPPHAVKPGDTWSKTIRSSSLSGYGSVKATFVKIGKVGRYRTAHIHTTVNIPINSMTDANNQPTTQASKAVLKTQGSVTMTYENDFAIAEGKMIRSAGKGSAKVKVTSKTQPPPSGKPTGAGATPGQGLSLTLQLATTSTLTP